MTVEFQNKKYKFFWNGMFSNWHLLDFVVDDVRYNCVEQYMMYQKALFFEDIEIANKILRTEFPDEQKRLGRKVKGFDLKDWDKIKYDLVKRGVKEKFFQNSILLKYLLQHKGCEIVEASPYDRIWGIGYSEKEAIKNIDDWGENLLGKILTELSRELCQI